MEVNFNYHANNEIQFRNINQEVFINNQPQPLNMNQLNNILIQMANSICKIVKGIKTGTGFLF